MPGFTMVNNPILEKVLISSFTKRQLKILLLIIRFSSGYQKTYAVLRRTDFSYAGVSASCVKAELAKLCRQRVVYWYPEKDMVWINPNLDEWAVDKSGDNLKGFFKIANKNCLKWQLRVCQNSNILSRLYKENNRNTDIKKENLFLKYLRDYFLRVSPLRAEEALILKELTQHYDLIAVEQAINQVSSGNDRSFSYFLKVLNALASNGRHGELSSLRSSLERYLKLFPKV